MPVTLDSLKKSVGKKNANSMVFAWLADLEREAGNLDAALQRVDGGLTLYPNDIAARLVRSKILMQQEAYEPCVQECEKILVMDPFNLAAQRIMGDAYDKLGNEAERNRCYRRLHDMDPLNTFWKDEYDVVLDVPAAAATAAALDAGLSFSDSTSDMDFSLGENDQAAPQDISFDSATDQPVEAATSAEGSFDVAADDDFAALTEEASADQDDPFASLAAMLPNGDSADDSAMDDLSASLDSAMDEINSESPIDAPVEEFGEEENISGSDVGSALSDMFGLEDDLEPEESTEANASPFSAASLPQDIPASIDENAQSNAESVFSSPAPAEDKPQSIDDAFGDIYGEDELPEELPQTAPATEDASAESLPSGIDEPSEEGGLFEKSAAFDTAAPEAPAADKPQSIDDAFGDIFGEDELPEEKPQNVEPAEELAPAESATDFAEPAADLVEPAVEDVSLDSAEDLSLPAEEELAPAEPAADLAEPDADLAEPAAEDLSLGSIDDLEMPAEEGGLFEKSADADMNLVEEDKPAESAPADDISTSVDNAFDSIFGEEDLAAPSEEAAAESETVSAEENELESLELPEESVAPAEETIAPAEEPVADLTAPAEIEELPAVEAAEETPAEEPAPEAAAPAADNAFSVDNAFDSLFGSEDDLPEEKPAEELESAAPAETAEENVSLADQVNQAEEELELPETKTETSDLAKEMGGAFASMFGNVDDDLDLPETPAQTAESEEVALEAPAAEEEASAKIEEDALSKDLDDSFDSLFGKDDDLELPSEDAPAETVAAPEPEPAPVAEEPASDLDSLESEVSGAFKGLFDMDDDSLSEESKPSNKGVDFLMSGDSDDEISAGLINNPDAPLDRGATDLDESLNTRTLAEIYFDQGLYAKALEIYKDLAQKEPENEEIAKRLAEVEKLYNDKFGGEA